MSEWGGYDEGPDTGLREALPAGRLAQVRRDRVQQLRRGQGRGRQFQRSTHWARVHHQGRRRPEARLDLSVCL